MTFSKKHFHLGKHEDKVDKLLKKFDKQNLVRRIWEKDSSVWKSGAEYKELITNRLGWLSLPETMKDNCDSINAFVDEVRNSGFTHAVVLGMGGSSMAPEVFAETFGSKDGYLKLLILDSTDPMTVFEIENSIVPEKTIFIVSSKSGSTIEVDSFFRYFFERITKLKPGKAGENFIAITDPGTILESLSKDKKFRRVFINPPDIGGRYSALSYFGLVPAALAGINIERLLIDAGAMMLKCRLQMSRKNPGVALGAAIGLLAQDGIDKLTFLLPEKIRSFGYWVEQLIAESTGKELKGVLPVEGESLGKKNFYGKDRVFVDVSLDKEGAKKKFLKEAGKKHPLISLSMNDLYDIGGQFYLWEFATALMGAVLGINPFDEPNVKESKDNTSDVLSKFEVNRELPVIDYTRTGKSLGIQSGIEKSDKQKKGKSNERKIVRLFLRKINKGDYVSLMAYIQKTEDSNNELEKIRELLRKKYRVAVTIGYGPRFLHSTGQFHKGGPDNGVFIQLVQDNERDLEIPGKSYSFGILKLAQSIGDYESLVRRKKRVLRVSVMNDVKAGLKEFYDLLKKNI